MSNKSKIYKPLTFVEILKEVASSIGAEILIEPRWEVAGRITFKNGRHSYFMYNAIDLNPYGTSKLVKDKDYTFFFLEKMGHKIIPNGKTFFSDAWGKIIGQPEINIDSAYIYAKQLGFPVVVKPNSGSQGSGVALVKNKAEFYTAMRAIFKTDRIAIVQPFVEGKDYRVVVLDNKVISAYQRIPLNVVGDGKTTIKQLLGKKQKNFDKIGRDTQIKLDDVRIKNKLGRQKLDFASVPKKGEVIYLLDNANLSTGGDSIDVTKKIHPRFKKLAIKLTRDMNLRLCGVDLIIDGDIADKPRNYWILEINASPGLDHYAKLGAEQAEIVKKLYLKVLKHLEKKPKR